ncbi:uncharacterized protein [Drosophila takahashii]|uniref:uncharacterized protein n=1 Tax=Drosophila takahashii TaxID=29030 RepID=UPI00389903B5
MSYSQDAGRSYSPFDAISPHNSILERIMHELEMSRRREELILKELEESKRKEEGNTKLLKTLTEEIIMLRGEVRQLKAFPVADPVTSRLNILPFDSLESFQEFDLKIYTDDELRRELKSKITRKEASFGQPKLIYPCRSFLLINKSQKCSIF